MKFINRFSLHLTYKEPYLHWYNEIFPDAPYSSLGELNATEKITYLIPIFDKDDAIEAFLEQNFKRFFDNELFSVAMEQKSWPAERTWEIFNEWFEADIYPVVVDFGQGDLTDETEDENGNWANNGFDNHSEEEDNTDFKISLN